MSELDKWLARDTPELSQEKLAELAGLAERNPDTLITVEAEVLAELVLGYRVVAEVTA